jgi:hypothetical protein
MSKTIFQSSFTKIMSLLSEVARISTKLLEGTVKGRPRLEIASLRSGATNLEESRKELIVAGFARSYKQFKNNVMLYVDFCSAVNWDPLVFSSYSTQSFVTIFRNQASCRNVIGSLKNLCALLMLPTTWDTVDLRKLMKNVGKLNIQDLPSEKPGIEIELLTKLSKLSQALFATTKILTWLEITTIMVLSFNFLLRLPSECIPIVNSLILKPMAHSAIFITNNSISLTLRRRKNSNVPLTLERECCCRVTKDTCPVHITKLWITTKNVKPDESLFTIKAQSFTEKLRQLLALLKVPNAATYTTHCFRRGAARSIIKKDLDPTLLKAAGLWASDEWSKYISRKDLAKNVVAKMLVELDEE